ncbi:MAG: sulfatase-like hydrolase/transferase [Elusimicrobiota bacterium]|jgi:hypothetical protein
MIPAVLSRLPLAAVCGLGSLFALLCHIPFTWRNFIADRRYPAFVERFLAAHPWLLLAAVVLAWLSLRSRPGSRKALGSWLGLHAAACLALAFHPLLPALDNDAWSLAWAFLLWLPCLSLEVLAALSPKPEGWGLRRLEEDRPIVLPVMAAAGFVFLAFISTHLLCRGPHGPALEVLPALGWDLAAHLLAASALVLVLAAVRDAASLALRPAQAGLGLLHLLLWLAAVWAFGSVALASVSFNGALGWLYAAVAAAGPVLLAFNAAASQDPVESRAPLPLCIALAAGLALAPYASYRLIKADWAFALATTATLAVWVLSLLLAFRLFERPNRETGGRIRLLLARTLRCEAWRPWRAAAGGLTLAAMCWAAGAVFTGLDPSFRRHGLHPRRALLRLANEEPSLRSLRTLLTLPAASSEGGYFQFLQRHTNIPRGTRLVLPEVEFSRTPAPSGQRPDVFFFVVDSLRSDHLGAYNKEARFTPSFDAFARESAVFRRSFSPYGGTGLSEPAFWAGALIPHMQYPSPFRPVNSLEKLVQRQGYRSLITVDQVLSAVLEPSTDTVRLDEDRVLYKFCDTLKEIEDRLSSTKPDRPVFVYTQPQDLHVSVIEKEGRASVSGAYPGFFAPYASRVARMDACFGRFVESLKRSGRWDRSVVIVTADHGDSLGEGDRWGHAYTIYPEVLSVPIMVHLPPSFAGRFAWDADAMALTTDLTPSLYALLGLAPARPALFFGRSLFRERSAPPLPPRPEHLAVSSYGPVYGVLRGDGRSLYIADGTAYREYLYRLGEGAAGAPATLDEAAARENRDIVRRWVGDMDRFYGFHPD